MPVRLLTEAISPCVPLEGVRPRPVRAGRSPRSRTRLVACTTVVGSAPRSRRSSKAEARVGHPHSDTGHGKARHHPLRGYLYDPFEYISTNSYGETRAYRCFVNVRVNEYIVGGGPPE